MKLLAGLSLVVLCGCGSDPPLITTFTVEPTTVARGADINVSLVVKNFELREPSVDEGLALRPEHDAGEGKAGDYPDGGHYHVYLDNTETNPLLTNCPEYCEHGASASPSRARIPDDATIGEHIVIVRLNNDEHLFLKPEITARTMLSVVMEN